MPDFTGVIIRKLKGRVCKEWKVLVDDSPENKEFAGKTINTASGIADLAVGDKVSMRLLPAKGIGRSTYMKLNIRAKIEECECGISDSAPAMAGAE